MTPSPALLQTDQAQRHRGPSMVWTRETLDGWVDGWVDGWMGGCMHA